MSMRYLGWLPDAEWQPLFAEYLSRADEFRAGDFHDLSVEVPD